MRSQRIGHYGQMLGAFFRHCGNALVETSASAEKLVHGEDLELVEEVASAGYQLRDIGIRLEARAAAHLEPRGKTTPSRRTAGRSERPVRPGSPTEGGG